MNLRWHWTDGRGESSPVHERGWAPKPARRRGRSALVDRAEALARSWIDEGTARSRAALAPIVRRLLKDLTRHYADLRAGPLFAEIPDERPELTRRIASLGCRQNEALRRLGALRRALRAPQRAEPYAETLDLMKELRAIERLERELLLDAVYTEIPALD